MFDFDGRSKFNSESVRPRLPRIDPPFHELWISGTTSLSTPSESCSCDMSSSPQTGTLTTTIPGPLSTSSAATSPPTTSPSLDPSSVSQPLVQTSTNSFTTPLDSRSSLNPTQTSPSAAQTTVNGRISLAGNTVCLGDGLDASVNGLLATIVLFGLIGLLLWVRCTLSYSCSQRRLTRLSYYLRSFGRVAVKYTGSGNGLYKKGAYETPILTPSCSYCQRNRPAPLRPTLWAFLNPPVPMVPSISNTPSDPNDPAHEDARKFPSDEELSQRTLWLCFVMVLGWSILGLIAALPLYTISVPCLAVTAPAPRYMGGYSTLQDLSVLRVLELLDDRNVSTSINTTVREVVNGQDLRWRGRLRIIILAALLVFVGLVPALIKILREYSKLVAFRRNWTDVHLQGKEMGWISARQVPGFAGWGEKRLKDFILKNGLSSSLDFSAEPASSGTGRNGRSGRRRQGGPYMFSEEDFGLEVDILSLFTIMYVSSHRSSLDYSWPLTKGLSSDTQRLALLIEERDIILEQLEIAETKYISSFRITTPEPSIADLNPGPGRDTEGIAYISRPRVLGRTVRRHLSDDLVILLWNFL